MYIKRIAESHIRSWVNTSKILLLLGGRQVGKTTLIKEVFKTTQTTYLNLDIEVDKQRVITAMPLDPASAITNLGRPEVLIIDEAQRLPDVSRTAKGWYDSGVFNKIVLSGSSSLNLLNQSAESLTGRNIKLFLPPLIFSEILSAQPWYNNTLKESIFLGAFSEQIQSLLLLSMVFGSYPETVITSAKVEYLQNLVSDFLLKDILQFGLVKTPEVFRRLLQLLAHQQGSVVSTNEIANMLQISRVTVDRYLDLLEQTFVIFRLPAYSTNPRKEIAKSQKIFFWDTGIRNALIGELNVSPLRSDIGQLWENWVITEFAKKNMLNGNRDMLYFWRSRIGSEVDLVIKKTDGSLHAYEIKWSPKKVHKKTFTNQYAIPVGLIHRDNIVQYLLTDLDYDLNEAEKEDLKEIVNVEKTLSQVRSKL